MYETLEIIAKEKGFAGMGRSGRGGEIYRGKMATARETSLRELNSIKRHNRIRFIASLALRESPHSDRHALAGRSDAHPEYRTR